jgi:hypothetical protein
MRIAAEGRVWDPPLREDADVLARGNAAGMDNGMMRGLE